jgi:hypothetical protein
MVENRQLGQTILQTKAEYKYPSQDCANVQFCQLGNK